MNYILKGAALILTLVVTTINLSCSNTDNEEPEPTTTPQEFLDQSIAEVDSGQLADDLATIDDYLSTEGLTENVLIEPNGVRYIINTLGTGVTPTLENVIQIKYEGQILSTGAEFDANDSFQTYLYRLVIGFQTSMPLLPTGTDVTLYIPSGYGYGPSAITDPSTGEIIIPANSNLIFHVELLATN